MSSRKNRPSHRELSVVHTCRQCGRRRRFSGNTTTAVMLAFVCSGWKHNLCPRCITSEVLPTASAGVHS